MRAKISVQLTLIGFFLVALTSNSFAQDTFVGLKAGSLGAGVELETSLGDMFGARLGANYLPYDYSGTGDDIKYDFDLQLMTLGAFLDWHPFKGSFRLTGGVLYNGNSLDATAESSQTFDIGDNTYTGDQVGTLAGEISFNDIVPYAGLGWNTAFGDDGNWGFIFELGVMFQGSPSADLSAIGTAANDPTFQADLAKEEKSLQDDLDNFEYYPVISIGFNYQF